MAGKLLSTEGRTGLNHFLDDCPGVPNSMPGATAGAAVRACRRRDTNIRTSSTGRSSRNRNLTAGQPLHSILPAEQKGRIVRRFSR